MTGISDGLYKTDDGAALRFYEEATQNNFASEKAGRVIYDTCLMCEVITPGSRESYPVFELERVYAEEVGIKEPARSPKFAEYSKQIEAFRNGGGGADLRGTPLTAWPAISVAIAATCQHVGIFTVEALAALPESRFGAVGPGARSLVERAKAFIAAAEGNAPTEALAAENVQLRADNERLTGDVTALSARLTALEQATPAVTPPPVIEVPVTVPGAEATATPPPVVTPDPVKPAKAAKVGGGNALPII